MKRLHKKVHGCKPLTSEVENCNPFERCCEQIARFSLGFFEAMTLTK